MSVYLTNIFRSIAILGIIVTVSVLVFAVYQYISDDLQFTALLISHLASMAIVALGMNAIVHFRFSIIRYVLFFIVTSAFIVSSSNLLGIQHPFGF